MEKLAQKTALCLEGEKEKDRQTTTGEKNKKQPRPTKEGLEGELKI